MDERRKLNRLTERALDPGRRLGDASKAPDNGKKPHSSGEAYLCRFLLYSLKQSRF